MGTKNFVLYSKPDGVLVKDINSHTKKKKPLDLVEVPPDLGFVVQVTVDERMYEAFAKNSQLLADVHDNIQKAKLYDNLVVTLAEAFEAANEGARASYIDADKAVQKALSIGSPKAMATAAAMVKIAQEAYRKHYADKKEYLIYEMKIAGSLTLGVVSLAGSIAALASTPFTFGASTILGGLAMTKTCTSMAKTIRASLQEAEEVFMKVMKIYVAITEAERSKTKDKKKNPWADIKLWNAELVNGIANAVLSIEPLDSLTTLKSKLDLAHKKVLGIGLQLPDITQSINHQYDKQMKYNGLLEHGDKGSPLSAKKIASTTAKLKKSEAKLVLLMDKQGKLNVRYQALVKIGGMYNDWVNAVLDKHRNVEKFGQVMAYLGTAYDIATAFAGFEADLDGITGAINDVVMAIGGEVTS